MSVIDVGFDLELRLAPPRPRVAVASSAEFDDEFDLDPRLGALAHRRPSAPAGAATDPVPLPTQGLGEHETCDTRNDTCPVTCHGHATCPDTQCATCPETCRETCPATCPGTCPETCPATCPETNCNTCPVTCVGDTCPGTQCDTCPDTCVGDTCPASCVGTCDATCEGDTCPVTGCFTCPETCPVSCAGTCDFPVCPKTGGIEESCDLFFSCEC